MSLKGGDGDPVRLGLPTDEELNRVVALHRVSTVAPERLALTGGLVKAAVLDAPVSEPVPALVASEQTAQKGDLRRSAQPRRYAVRAHRELVDAVYKELRARPELLGPATSREFKTGVFILLAMSGLRVKTAAVIAGVESSYRELMDRLTDNGIYRQGTWYGNWMDKETGDVEFVLTVLVALGIVVMHEELPAAPPRSSPQKPRPHPSSALGPEHCRVCAHVGGRCKRHGGPSRSTAFQGRDALACSYCRWQAGAGHAPTCRREVQKREANT